MWTSRACSSSTCATISPAPLSASLSGWWYCDSGHQDCSVYLAALCLVPQPLLSLAAIPLCLLCLRAKWTSLNGCFRMCCPCFRSARMLLLVTGSQAVSGYLTLQRHSCIVNPLSRGHGGELAPGLRQVPCLLWVPCRFRQRVRVQRPEACFCTCLGFFWELGLTSPKSSL